MNLEEQYKRETGKDPKMIVLMSLVGNRLKEEEIYTEQYIRFLEELVVFNVGKLIDFRDSLKKIHQFSDSGSYADSLIQIKKIAREALI